MSRKMNKLKQEFSELASTDNYEVVLEDGKTLELDMRVTDLGPFLTASDQKGMTEETFEKIVDSLRTILYRSYLPDYNMVKDKPEDSDENEEAKELVEKLLLAYIDELMVKVMQAAGLIDEDLDFDKLQEQGMEKNLPR